MIQTDRNNVRLRICSQADVVFFAEWKGLFFLFKQPVAHRSEAIGIVERIHVLAAFAIVWKDRFRSEVYDIYRSTFGKKSRGKGILLGLRQLGAPCGIAVFHAIFLRGFLKSLIPLND